MAKINFTKEQIDTIIKMYIEEKKSLNEISIFFNVSVTPIKRILKENNISIRTASENRREDLTGQRFGKLTVLKIDPDFVSASGKHTKWLCQCDCGKIKSVQSNHLKDGSQSACCPLCKNIIEKGSIFGMLEVLEPTGQRNVNSGAVMYLCQCSCGNKQLISSTELRAGRRKQCDKCNDSYGENKVKQLLEKNNIDYEKEKSFIDCINPETGRKLRFDFYLPDYNILIEVDGEQHFTSVEYWGGEKELEKIKIRDNIKNVYCKEKNIKLVRIKYNELDNLTIDKIL